MVCPSVVYLLWFPVSLWNCLKRTQLPVHHPVMATATQIIPKPGIKGGLIWVFIYLLVICVLFFGLLLFSLIGIAEEPGYLRSYLADQWPDIPTEFYVYMVLELGILIFQIVATAHIIWLMWFHKKRFIPRFLQFVFALAILGLIDSVSLSLLLGTEPDARGIGTGFIVMISVYYYLLRSKRAAATFVKE